MLEHTGETYKVSRVPRAQQGETRCILEGARLHWVSMGASRVHWEASGASRVQWQRPRSPLWHSKANWEGLGGLWEVIEGTRRPWEALECTGKIGSLQVALEHMRGH